jgi:hypothetical protein
MTLPVIAALPSAPVRQASPEDFFIDALAFLDAQNAFATQCNSLRTYLNAVNFNANDWGDLTAIGEGPELPTFAPLPVAPDAGALTGKPLVVAIDTFFAAIEGFPAGANDVAEYIDDLADPLADPDTNPERPSIPPVAEPPLRTDAVIAFNGKAASYFASLRPFSIGLNNLADYAAAFGGGEEDWGLITASHTSSEDWGAI